MKEKTPIRALEERCRQECYPIYFTRHGRDYTIPHSKEDFLQYAIEEARDCYDEKNRTPTMYSRRDYAGKRTWHIQFKDEVKP